MSYSLILFKILYFSCETRHYHHHYDHRRRYDDHYHNGHLLARLELLLLDWFFNDDDDAVYTSFLNGTVDVFMIILSRVYDYIEDGSEDELKDLD